MKIEAGIWYDIAIHTDLLLVPGGAIIRSYSKVYGDLGATGIAMVFVPMSWSAARQMVDDYARVAKEDA